MVTYKEVWGAGFIKNLLAGNGFDTSRTTTMTWKTKNTFFNRKVLRYKIEHIIGRCFLSDVQRTVKNIYQ